MLPVGSLESLSSLIDIGEASRQAHSVEGFIPGGLKGLFEKEPKLYTAEKAKGDLAIVDLLNQNPDFKREEILEKIKTSRPGRLKGSENQQFISERLDLFLKRRDEVKSVTDKYETPEQLFSGLFGKPPAGEIQVVRGPFSVNVICFHPEDFKHIAQANFANNPRGSTIIDGLGGCVLKECKEPCLNFAVVCSKSNDLLKEPPGNDQLTAEVVMEHEEQHVFNRLVTDQEQLERARSLPELKDLLEKNKDLPSEEAEKQMKEYFVSFREYLLEYGDKDELGAYLAIGLDPEQACWVVKQENYSKVHDYLMSELKGPLENLPGAPLARIILRNTFEDYNPVLEKLFDKVREMRTSGLSSREIAMILANEHVRQLI